MTEEASTSETSINFYQSTRRSVPDIFTIDNGFTFLFLVSIAVVPLETTQMCGRVAGWTRLENCVERRYS
jgi:hypothetical protein